MDAARDLHHLLDRALGQDPLDSLDATHRLTGEVSGWVTERAVLRARRHGASWAVVARLLQTSRQAAHRRFRHLDRIASIDRLPRRPPQVRAAANEARRTERLLRAVAPDRPRTDDDEPVAW